MGDSINVFAIAIAAFASFLLGGLWYSPVLFGKVWMKDSGVTEDQEKTANMIKTFSIAFLASLVICFNLSMFLGAERTLQSGLLYGFLTGFGWVAMAFVINDVFEQRPFRLTLINGGYYSLSFTIMGGIIGVWH
jgi:multidrug transporter EmrE-like cation transporter